MKAIIAGARRSIVLFCVTYTVVSFYYHTVTPRPIAAESRPVESRWYVGPAEDGPEDDRDEPRPAPVSHDIA